jgi:hypothetical protein
METPMLFATKSELQMLTSSSPDGKKAIRIRFHTTPDPRAIAGQPSPWTVLSLRDAALLRDMLQAALDQASGGTPPRTTPSH